MDSHHRYRLVALRIFYEIFTVLVYLHILSLSLFLPGIAVLTSCGLGSYIGTIFSGLLVGFLVCICLGTITANKINEIENAIENAQSQPSDQSHEINRRVQLEPQMAERREHSESSAARSFSTPAVARAFASLLVLPPWKIFKSRESNYQIIGSHDECGICLEEFRNGDLIQSFPMCSHDFHLACINTWLQGGSITCPNCRSSLQGKWESLL
ncbi:hypothetical protein L6164_016942 [Bauhinia variegata]|uniref:Uncharacterized protein n=1 Tax=Bauhinia variegata TaxID=167791 RepID=A0ACB9N892_BAUVA|nr:hypothetical protein L6164_016942 [Bauhinia variegata]